MKDTSRNRQHAAPQYSPDGRWWWDGGRWAPVDPGEVPCGPAPSEPVVTSASRVRRPPALVWGAGVGLAVLLIAGWIVGSWSAGETLQAGPRTSSSPSSGLRPQQLPYRYLPGVTVTDLTQLAREQGLNCEGPTIHLDLMEWDCRLQDGDDRYFLTIQARSLRQVHGVTALVSNAGQRPAADRVGALFDEVSAAPFESQPDLARQAQSWVRANLDQEDDASTTIGQVLFGIVNDQDSYFLDVDAGIG